MAKKKKRGQQAKGKGKEKKILSKRDRNRIKEESQECKRENLSNKIILLYNHNTHNMRLACG